MTLIAGHEVEVRNASQAIYNGFDCALTFQIDEVRQQVHQNDTLIYDFERGMQGPALEMMLRGFRVDIDERERAIYATKARRDDYKYILEQIMSAIPGSWTDKIVGSHKQLVDLFYNTMKLPEIAKHYNGEKKLPMDRETLEKLQQTNPWADVLINNILWTRDLNKTLQVLETEIRVGEPRFAGDLNWRWHCSYNIGGTSTGRWSSSKSPFGDGCVLPHTTALTPSGWRRVDEIKNGDTILQWNQLTDRLEWSVCQMLEKDYTGLMYKVKTEQLQQTLTAGHRVPYMNSRMDTLKIERADEAARVSQGNMLLGASLSGTSKLNIPAFAAMLMADFSKEGNTWRGQFTKQRKIDRFLHLAKEFELEWQEKPTKEGYRRFVVYGENWIPKKWGSWILDLTKESAEGLIEESRYWDATDRGSGFIFFTADGDQANWYSTLVHLVNRACTKRLMQQNEGSYSTTPIWWINVKDRSHARFQRKHWEKFEYSGKVYCPSVPSSYWLMQENGFISITGNSNFQNVTEELRRVFIPDPGYKLYGIDKAQSEARDVGWMCGMIFDDWSYLDACQSGDLHTNVTKMLYPEWSWTDDPKLNRQLAERRFYRLFTYRDASKRLGHASNYYGRPKEISRQTRIPLHLVEEFQRRYFAAFPCIRLMHTWVAEQLAKYRYLVNSFGRRRDFFDHPKSDETLKSAIAYLFQSATGDCLNLGLWRLWRHMGRKIEILSQLHDAVYFQAPIPKSPDAEQELLAEARSYIEIEQTHTRSGRRMTIPGEVVGGFNWAHRFRLLADGTKEEWNPKGLDGIRLAA